MFAKFLFWLTEHNAHINTKTHMKHHHITHSDTSGLYLMNQCFRCHRKKKNLRYMLRKTNKQTKTFGIDKP